MWQLKCFFFQLSQHKFRWPSGHSRFRYKQDDEGLFHLQTIRYSGDLKSDHSKSGNIWNPYFLKTRFQMVHFQMVELWSQLSFENGTIPNRDIFIQISNGSWQNGGIGPDLVGLWDFRSRLKSGPFANLPLFDHSRKMVRYHTLISSEKYQR